MNKVTVLIPTRNRPAALATTLTALAFQEFGDFSVFISDQSDIPVAADTVVLAAKRLLEHHNHPVVVRIHLPCRGVAEQRQFLLDNSSSRYSLFLDDDVLLESWALKGMVKAMERERCGFVGNAVIGLSFKDDFRPEEEAIEFWEEKVMPEKVRPQSKKWQRHKLHNAANLLHVAAKFRLTHRRQKKYKVAWLGGCVLYDTDKLRKVGGFGFWKGLPKGYAGEDALVQIRLMERYGGCGLIPSGAYHQELPTTIPLRKVNAPDVFG